MQHPDKGYRRIRDDLEHDFGMDVNDKRVLRICQAKKIKSAIKYSNHSCTHNASNPQYVAENVLKCDFHAPKPNVKWLTDVTEFKWYEGVEVHKIYLSATLDLYDRRIVSYVIGDRNDNPIVFDTFKATVKAHPDAHQLFHSDRGFQYTNQTFHHMLDSEPGYFRPERGRVHWQQSASRDSPRFLQDSPIKSMQQYQQDRESTDKSAIHVVLPGRYIPA